jgi:hypothetical protein
MPPQAPSSLQVLADNLPPPEWLFCPHTALTVLWSFGLSCAMLWLGDFGVLFLPQAETHTGGFFGLVHPMFSVCDRHWPREELGNMC